MERERLPHHSRQLQKSRWAKQAKPEHTCGEQNAEHSPRSLTRLSLDVIRAARRDLRGNTIAAGTVSRWEPHRSLAFRPVRARGSI